MMKTTIKRTFLAAMAAVTLLGGCTAATAPVLPAKGAKTVEAEKPQERIAADSVRKLLQADGSEANFWQIGEGGLNEHSEGTARFVGFGPGLGAGQGTADFWYWWFFWWYHGVHRFTGNPYTRVRWQYTVPHGKFLVIKGQDMGVTESEYRGYFYRHYYSYTQNSINNHVMEPPFLTTGYWWGGTSASSSGRDMYYLFGPGQVVNFSFDDVFNNVEFNKNYAKARALLANAAQYQGYAKQMTDIKDAWLGHAAKAKHPATIAYYKSVAAYYGTWADTWQGKADAATAEATALQDQREVDHLNSDENRHIRAAFTGYTIAAEIMRGNMAASK